MNEEKNYPKAGHIPILLNYGGAKKFVADMNDEELEEARQAIIERAREKAFSKGLPIYYGKDNKIIAEFSDGHIEVVD